MKSRLNVIVLWQFLRINPKGVCKLLALSFFTVVFSSLLWVIYSIVQVAGKLGDGGLANAGILDVSVYVAFVLLPVFAMWVIFGHYQPISA